MEEMVVRDMEEMSEGREGEGGGVVIYPWSDSCILAGSWSILYPPYSVLVVLTASWLFNLKEQMDLLLWAAFPKYDI